MANGQALVIVGESTLEQAVDKAGLTAGKHVAKELNTSAADIDQAVQEAATEVSWPGRSPARAWPSRPTSPNGATLEDT